MNEEPAVSYGALTSTPDSSSPNTTMLLDSEDAQLVADQSQGSEMGETPDQILNSYGPFNPYLLMIFCLMASVWALTAVNPITL
jgi:hypothetical protein